MTQTCVCAGLIAFRVMTIALRWRPCSWEQLSDESRNGMEKAAVAMRERGICGEEAFHVMTNALCCRPCSWEQLADERRDDMGNIRLRYMERLESIHGPAERRRVMNGRELYDYARHHYTPPGPDLWDKLSPRVQDTYEYLCWENHRAEGADYPEHPASLVPPELRSQFRTLAEAVGKGILRVGGTDFTDWKYDDKQDTSHSMCFDFGRNAYFVRVVLAEAGGAVSMAPPDIPGPRWKNPGV